MNNWNNLQPDAQLWFYTAKRPFTSIEVKEIELALQNFCHQWLAHNKKVHAGYKIINDQVIILGADNSMEPVSGCSIDSSVHFMQSLDTKYDLDLFNRLRALIVSKNSYETISSNSDELTPETLFLNIWAKTKGELDANPHLPINNTWYSRFVKVGI